ncbi:MAG: hypothetical protein JST00_04145 [Deltaproteobacteria bacterium]|nr:hypothetical protein [Deltaproteobacteria bacterium]
MISMIPAARAVNESNVDTILTLPEQTGSVALANACRETALELLNDGQRWGKAELATWLMGPYSQLTQYVAGRGQRNAAEPVRTVPMLREIDARMVDRVLKNARLEVLEALKSTYDAEGGAAFAFTMLSNGFVARCEDRSHVAGWVPTTDARRLADRVMSLLAADYLTRANDYETELSICSRCSYVEFDAVARMRGICHRHGSGLFIPKSTRRSTWPYLPEGA